MAELNVPSILDKLRKRRAQIAEENLILIDAIAKLEANPKLVEDFDVIFRALGWIRD